MTEVVLFWDIVREVDSQDIQIRAMDLVLENNKKDSKYQNMIQDLIYG